MVVNKIACVTGATGMIGERIVQRLLSEGYQVRILSRKDDCSIEGIQLFVGNLQDEKVVRSFLIGCDLVFHCAAELYDESQMWNVNVMGTELLIRLATEVKVKYFCFISSAGVVGHTITTLVDEQTPCSPNNVYERSKWAAEQLVINELKACKVVVLRPTNVVDGKRPGAILFPIRATFIDRVKVFFKGGECAHIVHADDVSDAAVYFISSPINDEFPIFFVSCDEHPLNTFAGIWSLYRTMVHKNGFEFIEPVIHLPIVIPHILRKIWRGTSNWGNIRYSSKKLSNSGFKFRLGFVGTVQEVAQYQGDRIL